jgi:hypothetical protein
MVLHSFSTRTTVMPHILYNGFKHINVIRSGIKLPQVKALNIDRSSYELQQQVIFFSCLANVLGVNISFQNNTPAKVKSSTPRAKRKQAKSNFFEVHPNMRVT